MARPERYDVDYFPHKCKHGGRMLVLENKFGNDGYAVFFKLLERMGSTQYHYLDLNDESELIYLEAMCRVDLDRLNNIIKECVRIKFFDREMFEKYNFLWSDDFYSSVKDAYKQRNNKPYSKDDIIQVKRVNKDGNLFNMRDNPQRKEKDTILEERVNAEPSSPSSPSLEILKKFFLENGYKAEVAEKAYHTYAPKWQDTKGNVIRDWQAKMRKVWFRPENELITTTTAQQVVLPVIKPLSEIRAEERAEKTNTSPTRRTAKWKPIKDLEKHQHQLNLLIWSNILASCPRKR